MIELVSKNYAIELLKKSLERYTPSRNESELANFLKDKCLNDLGFERASIDSVGNLIAMKGSGNPKVMLCGHMDTVPGIVPVRLENDFLFGRGASDAKGPLISMLLAASNFPKQNCTIIFAGVVDEEGNATGIKNLVKDKINADYAIFGEPSGITNITIGYKGRLALRLTCDVGDSAHASAPWLARNSIEEMYDVVGELKEKINSFNPTERKTDSVSYCLTEINGGSSHNVTPDKCRVTLDIRIPRLTNCNCILEKLDLFIKELSIKKSVRLTYRVEDKTDPFETNPNSPLTRALSLSIIDVCKRRPNLQRKTGTGDMNVLGNFLNIPVVTYGPGDPHSSHTSDEHISISEYLSSIDIIENTLFHVARLHKKNPT